MTKPKVAIIVPTIRETSLKKFLELWKKEFSIAAEQYDICLYIVEDNPQPSFKVTQKKLSYLVRHLAWQDIDQHLGKSAWIIPHRSDAVRSYGVYLAYQQDCQYFITLDDDCYPHYDQRNSDGYFVEGHIQNLKSFSAPQVAWVNTIQHYKPRGYPWGEITATRSAQNVAISHGLWVNVPDFDSITALSTAKKDQYYDHVYDVIIPNNHFFPMCSMNLAWTRAVTPIMYFLLMGEDENGQKYVYDRFGDIWCGLFAKKIIDHLGKSAVSGSPYIYHDRASDSFVNLQKEAPGIKLNEVLWRDVDAMKFTSTSLKKTYQELIAQLPLYTPYWEKLTKAMTLWIDLF